MINNFESNVQYIKYLVNKEVAKRFFLGNLDNSIDSVREIAEEIIPGPKPCSAAVFIKNAISLKIVCVW